MSLNTHTLSNEDDKYLKVIFFCCGRKGGKSEWNDENSILRRKENKESENWTSDGFE